MINAMEIHLNEIKKIVYSIEENENDPNEKKFIIENQPSPMVNKITPEPVIDSVEKFPELKNLVNNSNWENAVPPDLLCDENNHEDKMDRARGIRDVFYTDYSYTGKKILDFGTGYGHLVAAIAENNPEKVVGYDINNNFQIVSNEKILLTNDWTQVVSNGTYDLIFIYDVIDHVEKESPKSILEKAKSVLNQNGIIRMRCHPFISKHGGHVYNKINKSYVHLVLDKNELARLGHDFKNYPTVQVRTPLMTYNRFINDAKLKIIDQKVVSESVDDFCIKGEIAERIKKNMGITNLMIQQMGMQFIDYTLGK